jgi:two-component system sensor histidine kinase HydH
MRAEGHGLNGITSEHRRILLIATLVVIATGLHYGINVQEGAIHDVLLRSYYLPIVLAGLWFGARGGLTTAIVVSVIFLPHALHGWVAPYTDVFRLIEIVMYNVIGALTGVMSSRARRALEAEKFARIEREQAYEALRAKTAQLFEMEDQLRRSERLAALGRMSAGLAHEIRNPLASIKTSVELLEEPTARGEKELPGSRATELLQVLAEETSRLNRILTEFLRFARVEAQAYDHAPTRCTIAGALNSTLSLVGQDLDATGISVEHEPGNLDREVSIIEDHLQQVLLNLLLNASDAMVDGGTVRVRVCDETSETVTLSVEDDGPGIPPEVARSVFDPFFSTKEGGVGLGLSIVARMLEASGGGIKLDRNHSPGARFLITLPRADR